MSSFRLKNKPGDNPCYKCPDRQVGCHGTCQKYISWTTERQEYANSLNDLKEKQNQHYDYVKEVMKKNRQHKHRR